MTSHSEVRVRFAPSPTGFLHIGGVRAALFNWLYAKRHGGKFLLRIEDTDLERSQENYTTDILACLKWLGLHWDEEPIYQSKRLEVYRERAENLIQAGYAYRCYCSEEEIEAGRKRLEAEGKKPMYDRRCRERDPSHNPSAPFVIRAKVPLTGKIEFDDLIREKVIFDNSELDDFVLIRSNGAPTYNLSVVVDDVHSRMTHVIRGDDHINNTPKQMHLYKFFGYPVPQFAHLPMILGADKKKLSKRHGAVSANAYRAEGYLPEALLNFLARLGWSHGDQEIFTIQEMCEYFSFEHVQKSSAVFNTEKLNWLNGSYLRNTPAERLVAIVAEDFAEHFSNESFARLRTTIGTRLVGLVQAKVKLVKEIAEQVVPLCTPGAVEVDLANLKWGKDPSAKPVIQAAVKHALETMDGKIQNASSVTRTGTDAVWGSSPSLQDAGIGHAEVDALLRQIGEQHGVKLGDLTQPMRLLVSGRAVSAGLFDLLPLLPWDVVEPRLKKVLQF